MWEAMAVQNPPQLETEARETTRVSDSLEQNDWNGNGQHAQTANPFEDMDFPSEASSPTNGASRPRSFTGKIGNLGRSAKRYRDWLPGKTAVNSMVRSLRSKKLENFRDGLDSGRVAEELNAMLAEPPESVAARVLAVRHGMGHHNDLGGALSVFNRDATLNKVGHEQACAMRDFMVSLGVVHDLDLLVVSPFTRALETAAQLLGPLAQCTPTIVQPLCAEHTLARSTMQQGDRGSTAAELRQTFPEEEFPQFDFSPLEQYCSSRGLDDGKWWLHKKGERHESADSFATRASDFCEWLGRECAARSSRRVLLVSHGGLLSQAFGGPEFKTCECRAIDVWPDGSFNRVLDEEASTNASVSDPASSGIRIDSVHCNDGVTYYSVVSSAAAPAIRRYSEFRALKKQLRKLGKDDCGREFPSKLGFGGSRREHLQTWLRALVAIHGLEHVLVAAFLECREQAAPCDN
eukprot:TRINITY_DN77886_c0_g1_i1.p1 TRINITY_DN77886_c0_g1~~TRINITY_DN77886_c0_g1_i1.p1  ORF type:complete len:463 (+),score=67.74 TRINITY_DN77886_c0_g1_i1:130-1518(+)